MARTRRCHKVEACVIHNLVTISLLVQANAAFGSDHNVPMQEKPGPSRAPYLVGVMVLIILGILWLNNYREAQYVQNRTFCLSFCKLLRVILMAYYGESAVCWPQGERHYSGLPGIVVQAMVAAQKNGRLVFMVFMVLAGRVRPTLRKQIIFLSLVVLQMLATFQMLGFPPVQRPFVPHIVCNDIVCPLRAWDARLVSCLPSVCECLGRGAC